MENAIYYLELSKNPIRFDVASQLTSVFFDDTNKQVNQRNVYAGGQPLYSIYY